MQLTSEQWDTVESALYYFQGRMFVSAAELSKVVDTLAAIQQQRSTQAETIGMWTETHVANVLGNGEHPITYNQAHNLAMRIIAHHELMYQRACAVLEKQQRQEATVWEPLPDGLYLDGALAISYNGTDIGFKVDDEDYKGKDWVNNYQWLSDCEVRDLRAKEEQYRMCRRIVGENGASDG